MQVLREFILVKVNIFLSILLGKISAKFTPVTMNHEEVQKLLSTIGNAVCDHVYQSLQAKSHEELSEVAEETKEDTIYEIDKDVEKVIIPLLEKNAEALGGIKLIAEGFSNEKDKCIFPSHFSEEQATVLIIMDPIDGTRGIMYNKRSAFFLATAAPNTIHQSCIRDLEVAVMTEIPTSKAYLSDSFYAIRNLGAFGYRRNLFNNNI